MLCFRKFPVAKNFTDKWRGGVGSITIFCRKFFVSVPKTFVGEPFLISEKIWYRKFSCIRRWAASQFSVAVIKLRNVVKGWDSNQYLPLHNPVFLPVVPWEPLEFLTNVNEIIEKFGTTEAPTRTYSRNFRPIPTAVIYFRIKIVGNCNTYAAKKMQVKSCYWKVSKEFCAFRIHFIELLGPSAIIRLYKNFQKSMDETWNMRRCHTAIVSVKSI